MSERMERYREMVENALPYAARFDYLTARHGPQSVSATLAYGSGTKGAKITIKARGRF